MGNICTVDTPVPGYKCLSEEDTGSGLQRLLKGGCGVIREILIYSHNINVSDQAVVSCYCAY